MSPQESRRMALIKVWDAMFRGARKYVEEQGFIGVHNAPELVGITGACENVDTLFKVDFFGKQAYLAQSDQLYLELLTPHLKKVYAEIQSFRMEPEADARHLCQFSLFEIEHLGDLKELQRNLTGIIRGAVCQVLEDCHNELMDLGVSLKHYSDLGELGRAEVPISEVTYTQAVAFLHDTQFPNLQWGDDLKADHEAALVAAHGPMFVTHYPLSSKFFNMKETCGSGDATSPLPEATVNSCDLLLPYAGESAGAAERETEHGRIVERLKSSEMYERLIELGGTDEDFEWYLEAHRGRDIPLHSGAGIGMARVAQFILGAKDIRAAVPFLINKDNLL